VAGASPKALRTLLQRTMVQPTERDRFRIHDLLHQYAAERLAADTDEMGRVAEAHASYFAAQLSAMSRDLKSPRQQAALAAGDADAANLSKAWAWAVENRRLAWLDEGLEGICLYYDLRGRYKEGEATCRQLVRAFEEAAADPLALLRAQLWLARFCRQLGKNEAALTLRVHVARALTASKGDDTSRTRIAAFLNHEEGKTQFTTDLAAALAAQERSADEFAAIGEHWWANKASTALGLSLNHAGRYEESTRLLTECAKTWRQFGDVKGEAHCRSWAAFSLLRRGRVSEAVPILQEASDLSRASGDTAGAAASLRQLGQSLIWSGQYAECLQPFERAQRLFQELGDCFQVASMFVYIGVAKAYLGDYGGAQFAIEAALALAETHGYVRERAFSLFIRGMVATALRRSDQAIADMAESLRLYEMVQHEDERVLPSAGMAYALIGLEEIDAAVEHVRRALEHAVAYRSYLTLVHSLPAAALILVARGDVLRALEICASARQLPVATANMLLDDLAFKPIADMSAGLDPELIAAAQERAGASEPWEVAATLLTELSAG
jgi:tetratricopeptide (TPR) repeat protein